MSKSITVLLFFIGYSFFANAQTPPAKVPVDEVKKLINSAAAEAKDEIITDPGKQLMEYAQSLLGIRYKYASGNPESGFDCSGFVSYVFRNFGFKVPRSSVEFSKVGTQSNLQNAKIGDVLIFTGSNPKIRRIGHVGIVYAVDGADIKFIHASSGKARKVMISSFDAYYRSRFIKIVSIL